MTPNADLLFHQTPEQLRRIGARGGRACARNRRARLRLAGPHPLQARESVPPHVEATAEAIATLDAQFPWLCGAEERLPPRNQ